MNRPAPSLRARALRPLVLGAGVVVGGAAGGGLLGCGDKTAPAETITVGDKIPAKHDVLGSGDATEKNKFDPKNGIGPHGGHDGKGAQASKLQTVAKDAVVLKVDELTFTRDDFDHALYQAAALSGVMPEMLDNQMRNAFEQPAYEKLVERTLLVREAKRRNLWPSDDEAKKQTDEMLKTLPPGKTLADMLVQLGIDEASFRLDVQRDVAIGKLLKALQEEMPPPADDVVTKIYEANKATFAIPDVASASHILVRVDRAAGKDLLAAKKKEAMAVLALVKGKDAVTFAKVAAEKSEDPTGKSRGGDVGAFKRGDLPAEFEALAFSLKDGEVGGPIQTDRGWHVLRGGGVTKGRVVPVDEAKKIIVEREKVKGFMAKIDDTVAALRTAAKIERVVEPLPSPLIDPNEPGSKVPSWRANANNALRGMRNPHGGGGDVPLPAAP